MRDVVRFGFVGLWDQLEGMMGVCWGGLFRHFCLATGIVLYGLQHIVISDRTPLTLRDSARRTGSRRLLSTYIHTAGKKSRLRKWDSLLGCNCLGVDCFSVPGVWSGVTKGAVDRGKSDVRQHPFHTHNHGQKRAVLVPRIHFLSSKPKSRDLSSFFANPLRTPSPAHSPVHVFEGGIRIN